MSNSASISAAKKRRGGVPGMGPGPGQGQGQGMSLPPGLPPNFRQLPPQIQQQLFQQLQQRAAAAAAAAAKSGPPPAPQQTRIPTPGPGNNTINVAGPYTVNPVIHNRAMAEVDGIHIRDLPISSSGLPCLPSGAALPPNVLFKLHHDELLNMDATLNEHSNRIQMLANRIDKGPHSNGNTGSGSGSDNGNKKSDNSDFSYDTLVNNTDFITKLLDNILTNTNLSDIINQIEPLQKENESLRSLLNSQQTTLNELSSLVMKLLANGLPSYNNGEYENTSHDNTSRDITTSENTPHENRGHDIGASVYNPHVGEYNEQDMSESSYMCNSVEGVGLGMGVSGVYNLSTGELEEVVEEGEVDGVES